MWTDADAWQQQPVGVPASADGRVADVPPSLWNSACLRQQGCACSRKAEFLAKSLDEDAERFPWCGSS